ncbi:hypothetical protein [Spirosoma sp. KNUC1025]|uniref:hypothetical protein n=1 Tax=Spirosoma sp. KNUC1025 TaxID=2894082 RepID=UPI00386DCE76|nr:hypothetical protein LN737_02080 [Spirosoma sp. KNUC1025]
MKLRTCWLLNLCCFLAVSGWAQPPARSNVSAHFLTDSIEIGRPFQYALTYRHPSQTDALFPDTATHFRPYRVQRVDVYATQTTGSGSAAVSRDSAVYTLLSFETDSIQLLRVPIRILNDVDCTALWTPTDTVFLHSKLTSAQLRSTNPQAFTLATTTSLIPLQQQFNYAMLIKGLLAISFVTASVYGLFGRTIRRQWRLYRLNRRHLQFLRNYNQLSQSLTSLTASETANQAIVMWKMYLERLDRQPYISLTTPELAERISDKRVTDALREADRMIYGGTFSAQSQPALWILRDVATQVYHRSRARLQRPVHNPAEAIQQSDSTENPTYS